jgi:hypothetical protein
MRGGSTNSAVSKIDGHADDRFLCGGRRLIRPIDTRYKDAEVTFSPRAGMTDERRGGAFQSIGSLTASGDSLSAYVFIPAEYMPELAAVAQSGPRTDHQLLRHASSLPSVRGVSLSTRDEAKEKESA